jgi:hypothetical protein
MPISSAATVTGIRMLYAPGSFRMLSPTISSSVRGRPQSARVVLFQLRSRRRERRLCARCGERRGHAGFRSAFLEFWSGMVSPRSYRLLLKEGREWAERLDGPSRWFSRTAGDRSTGRKPATLLVTRWGYTCNLERPRDGQSAPRVGPNLSALTVATLTNRAVTAILSASSNQNTNLGDAKCILGEGRQQFHVYRRASKRRELFRTP